ncbi:MAG: aminopeptidase P family protein [Dictyoglomi bacterium]|nr:aminopeptidase P family protein [Dictyoglomota bacterium]
MRERVETLRQRLNLVEGEAYLTTTSHHLYYLTGFTGGEGYLIITGESIKLLVDGRYTTQAADEVWDGVEVILFTKIWEELPSYLKEIKKLWIEENVITVKFINKLREIVPWIETFSGADEYLYKMRMVKDEYERTLIEKAIDIAQNAFLKTLEIIRPGVTERDIASELCYHMRRLGGDKESFDIIVASGYRGALPHGVASDKKVKEGEVIVIDWGAFYKGYVSDLTRMVVVGKISEKAEEVLQAVKGAQETAIRGAKCCMTAKEIDALARNYLKDKGLAEYFTHSLGHGIGIEIHEMPRVSYMSDEIIDKNIIFTIEPGVYLPGEFGVRIEDDVMMTENGVIVLSSLDKIFRL